MSAAATALAMSAVVWHFAAPQWTLRQLQAAVEARDAAALADYVDFPALRNSLTAEPAAATRAGEGRAPRGAATPDASLDRLVTPAGIAALIADGAGSGAAALDTIAIEREGFSTFRVVGDPRAGALVFRRQGYGWKLAAIDPPPRAGALAR